MKKSLIGFILIFTSSTHAFNGLFTVIQRSVITMLEQHHQESISSGLPIQGILIGFGVVMISFPIVYVFLRCQGDRQRNNNACIQENYWCIPLGQEYVV